MAQVAPSTITPDLTVWIRRQREKRQDAKAHVWTLCEVCHKVADPNGVVDGAREEI